MIQQTKLSIIKEKRNTLAKNFYTSVEKSPIPVDNYGNNCSRSCSILAIISLVGQV